ncbi:cytochrome b6/f complex, subunit 5 [Cynara cardunculus var. scolymus]|uniref:PSI-J n=1 Tax=Cynara cardunculus var. scolymus TaxID=59895 RepID=A0A118HJW6_CYNCS|nr:cytochrome b6/f complex, subunit 5 [Cynara cardunculus var. scolymus]
MIEVFLFGIVLGLIPITLAGLFVTAYLQYRRFFNARSKNISFRGGLLIEINRFFSDALTFPFFFILVINLGRNKEN